MMQLLRAHHAVSVRDLTAELDANHSSDNTSFSGIIFMYLFLHQ